MKIVVAQANIEADPLVVAIASGKTSQALSYKHFTHCGKHYRAKECDETIGSTNDSFVMATFSQQSVASRADNNPIGVDLNYVGYITDIISYVYDNLVHVVLLRVQWYRVVVEENHAQGLVSTPQNAIIPKDESGLQIVDTSQFCGIEEEPFAIVEQVTQCFCLLLRKIMHGHL